MYIKILFSLSTIFILVSCVFIDLPPEKISKKETNDSLLVSADSEYINPILSVNSSIQDNSCQRKMLIKKTYFNPNHYPVTKNEYLDFCKKINKTFLLSNMSSQEAFSFFKKLQEYSYLQRHFYHKESVLNSNEQKKSRVFMMKKITEKHYQIFSIMSYSSGNRILTYENVFFHTYSVSAELIEQWSELNAIKKRHKKVVY